MFLPHPHISQRASASTAGSGIAAGGLAASSSGGGEKSTKFILGFAIGVPCFIILVVAGWYFRRRHNRKLARKNGDPEPGMKTKAKNTGVGKRKRKKEGRVSKFFGWGDRIKPAAGYGTEKQYF